MNKCPKCNGEMEDGYTHDSQNAWVDFITKKTKWVKGGSGMRIGLDINSKIDITTYRCKNCGFLESYAK